MSKAGLRAYDTLGKLTSADTLDPLRVDGKLLSSQLAVGGHIHAVCAGISVIVTGISP